ncbi:MAG: hypothetical protein HeimC2_02940 [Candidatus Heimdallarchaeota archaeon LC_2]|nr:MAG: hypothetical protein HeimC2_02940 [Candidatus Heimdallarchaeota archaeon LC_2]
MMSNPGTNGPKNMETEGAITAMTEVEQHTADEANADIDAEIDDTEVEALEIFISSSFTALSTSVQTFGKVSKDAYKRPDRNDITNNEIPGS